MSSRKSKKSLKDEILELQAKYIMPCVEAWHNILFVKGKGTFLLDSEGNLLVCSEDMGRHNAVDKVIGAALIRELSFQDKIIVTSGRASLEMILKTARAGIPVFVAMSRPTSRAVEAAKFYNITLLDMARDSNRIYSHVRRIKGF